MTSTMTFSFISKGYEEKSQVEAVTEGPAYVGIKLDILSYMAIDNIVSSIDAEIARLKQARALLSSSDGKKTATAAPVRKRRKLSKAARAKIADAQRKRWAKQKAATGK
jgi:hypothetical protein